MTTLVDTGALVALLDRSDAHHEWAKRCFQHLKPPLLTCEAVLTETCYLLRTLSTSQRTLAAFHDAGLVATTAVFDSPAEAVWKRLRKYADVPMDLADACLVHLSEEIRDSEVWTTDSDFKVYRRFGRRVIPVRAPWSS